MHTHTLPLPYTQEFGCDYWNLLYSSDDLCISSLYILNLEICIFNIIPKCVTTGLKVIK